MRKTQLYLGALLGLQLLLGGGLFVSQASSGSGAAARPLLGFDTAEVDRLQLATADSSLSLQRRDGNWQLADSGLPANTTKVQSLLDNLAGLQTNWPVASTAGGRTRFEVAEDKFQRRLQLARGEEPLAELYFGTSPGFRQTHGRRGGEDEVYTLAFNSAVDLPLDRNDWLDKGLLRVDGVERIEGSDFTLRKDGESWTLEQLPEGRSLDQEKARSLATALQTLRVLRLLEQEPTPGENDSTESHSLTAVKGNERWQYTLTKVGSSAYIARDGYEQRFALSSADYDRLAKAALDDLLLPADPEN
jgi:hypothetical protein